MKGKYWWVIAAAIAVVVGINMCEGDPSHTPSAVAPSAPPTDR